MKLEITAITIFHTTHGADRIYLKTNLPCASWPYKGVEDLEIRAARGSAESYCRNNFPELPVQVRHE